MITRPVGARLIEVIELCEEHGGLTYTELHALGRSAHQKLVDTVDFLGVWEQLNNPGFNLVEFHLIKNESGLNRKRQGFDGESPSIHQVFSGHSFQRCPL